MKPISIDFAPASLSRTLHKTSWLSGIAFICGGVFCISLAFNIVDLRQQESALRLQRQAIDNQVSSRRAHQPVSHLPSINDVQAKAIDSATAQLNLPWSELLNAVEAATPHTIALLSLEPDGKKYLLKGIAEAKSPENMLHYVHTLKQQAFFTNVILTKHAVNEQDPNKPLRFQFEAQWKGDQP